MSDDTRRDGRSAQPAPSTHNDAHAGKAARETPGTPTLARRSPSVADLVFDEEHHTYWLGPVRVPNVTEIIAPLVDYSNAPAFMVEYKRDLGSAVHRACELYDREDLDESQLDERVVPYLEGWKQFCWEHSPGWVAIEERVLSLDPLFAGTLDRVAVIDDTLTTLDIKTTSRLHPAAAVQLTAYQHAQNHATDALWAVQLKPDGTYHVERYPACSDELMDVFLACLTIRNWKELYK